MTKFMLEVYFQKDILTIEYEIAEEISLEEQKEIKGYLERILTNYWPIEVNQILNWLRTLFSNYTEKRVELDLIQDNYHYEIKITDGNNYEKIAKTDVLNNKYIYDYRINIDSKKTPLEILKLMGCQKSCLTMEDKKLIAVYQNFYGHNPDFSSSTISKELKIMLYILRQYNFSDLLYRYYSIVLDTEINEEYVDTIATDLAPFRLNDYAYLTDVLTDSDKKKIQAIGKTIVGQLNEYPDPVKITILKDLITMYRLGIISIEAYEEYKQNHNIELVGMDRGPRLIQKVNENWTKVNR